MKAEKEGRGGNGKDVTIPATRGKFRKTSNEAHRHESPNGLDATLLTKKRKPGKEDLTKEQAPHTNLVKK